MASKKKVTGGKRPQNLRRTLGQFSAYLGRHRIKMCIRDRHIGFHQHSSYACCF